MKNPLSIIIAILTLLWAFLGSFFSNKYCNCSSAAAALPAVVAPLSGDVTTKSIRLADTEKNFTAGTNDNLLFPPSKCDYLMPVAEPLTKVFSDAVNHLKKNPDRILVLTGLYRGEETNECANAKDLGYGRADKVKAMLAGMGAPENQIRAQSVQREVALFEGNVLGGVEYEFISGNVGDVEKRLRDIGNINLYFETNARDLNLSIEQQRYFEDLKAFIALKPDAKVLVSGHTDNKGGTSFNKRLSRKRAEYVMDYMSRNGIPIRNMTSEGFGIVKPIDTNDTEEGRAKNRRVEVTIQ